ncbi:MAG: cation-translocating P-type ATPase, partial [Candidatus Limnocylindrales bacterium]
MDEGRATEVTTPGGTAPDGNGPETAGAETGGLTSAAAAGRLRIEGPNAIEERGQRSMARILLGQFSSPLVVLLLVACGVSVAVGDDVDAGIILVIVVLSAALGFVQEARSETAVKALRARLALRATVVRDGHTQEVAVHDLVRGDLVLLAAGDIVPGDGRLVSANHLYVDESAMTGESAPALKSVTSATSAAVLRPATPAGSAKPAEPVLRPDQGVLFGTSVVSGEGRAIITATGTRTAYGLIAHRLLERAPRNDFERGVRSFGLLIARVILLLVLGVFAADVALQKPLLESFLFALALAVGLTPELLPAIVTVNLSRGARALAAVGVLVKRLPAIQNLGATTVLCTDKTGTLTEGRLTFERSARADGTTAPDLLALAWLNSHFETGFANPLDAAILAATATPPDGSTYRKLAELPFDFDRRCLSVLLVEPGGGPVLICKGAPEAILARCTAVRKGPGTQPMGEAERAVVEKQIATAAAAGDRTIGLATRREGLGDHLDQHSEATLTYEGLLSFSDPPKADIAATLAELRDLHVDLRIVTGDSDLVARAVARQVGLPVHGVLTGEQLGHLSHTAFAARAQRTTIFARMNPD